jgi:hypothetical protein
MIGEDLHVLHAVVYYQMHATLTNDVLQDGSVAVDIRVRYKYEISDYTAKIERTVTITIIVLVVASISNNKIIITIYITEFGDC